jgi:flagellar hook-associated protein 3 FlgL
MAITPINVNRVSHGLRTMTLVESFRSNTLALFREQNKLATGLRILQPSDDPVGATRALKLTELREQQDQILNNLQFADRFLAQTDSTMNDINELLIDAQSIASSNVGSTVTQDERDASASLIDSIVRQLVAIGNREFQGIFQFSGHRTTTVPFIEDTDEVGGIRYDGDSGNLLAHVDRFQDEAFNLSGNALYGALSAQVKGFADLNPALASNTRLESINGALNGRIDKGIFTITDSTIPGTFNVDLATADTIGNIVNLINDASTQAGGSVTASLTATGITLTGGGTIGVSEVGNGLIARQLGLYTVPPAGSPVAGADLSPKLTGTTAISALNGGAGIDTASGFIIKNGIKSVTIDISAVNTIQELFDEINLAGVGVRAELNADRTGINIFNDVSGALMSIGENGGTTATDLGIRSYHANTLLGDLNFGNGVTTKSGEPDFVISDADGVQFSVDVTGDITVQDVIDTINAAAGAAGSTLTASLNPLGSGLRLGHAAPGAQTITVSPAGVNRFAMEDLGLAGGTGNTQEFIAQDTGQVRVEGVFTALNDLRTGLRTGSSQQITDASTRLDSLMKELNRVHGIVGSRSQALRKRLEFTEDAVLATQTLISEVRDLDYTTAVTEFQQAQTALQANLLTGSQLLNLSLLDFLR